MPRDGKCLSCLRQTSSRVHGSSEEFSSRRFFNAGMQQQHPTQQLFFIKERHVEVKARYRLDRRPLLLCSGENARLQRSPYLNNECLDTAVATTGSEKFTPKMDHIPFKASETVLFERRIKSNKLETFFETREVSSFCDSQVTFQV